MEGQSAKMPAALKRTRCEGRAKRLLPLLGMRIRRSSRCAPAATWMASTSVPRSSTADAGASWSAFLYTKELFIFNVHVRLMYMNFSGQRRHGMADPDTVHVQVRVSQR